MRVFPFFVSQALMAPQHVLSSEYSITACGSLPNSDTFSSTSSSSSPSPSPHPVVHVAARSPAVFRALYDIAHELLVRHTHVAATGDNGDGITTAAAFTGVVRCLLACVMRPDAENAEEGAALIAR